MGKILAFFVWQFLCVYYITFFVWEKMYGNFCMGALHSNFCMGKMLVIFVWQFLCACNT